MKQEDAHKGMLAVNENIGSVVPQTGGEGNQSRTVKICVCGHGGLHIFAVHVGHSDGWTSKNDALMDAVSKQHCKNKEPVDWCSSWKQET